ncbi:hypothetical protein BT67DRAFT_206271 [Trichocladium antarcticum]|uniref:Uncharacterized protein n=1 Tax=Trichocladium antarcticum TaxID=1450529 RepID=A0AAN6ZB42_9PEZI|nr:hypothetical protein BT67DRAFT_206271 [Trichocladium antarcticum]
MPGCWVARASAGVLFPTMWGGCIYFCVGIDWMACAMLPSHCEWSLGQSSWWHCMNARTLFFQCHDGFAAVACNTSVELSRHGVGRSGSLVVVCPHSILRAAEAARLSQENTEYFKCKRCVIYRVLF